MLRTHLFHPPFCTLGSNLYCWQIFPCHNQDTKIVEAPLAYPPAPNTNPPKLAAYRVLYIAHTSDRPPILYLFVYSCISILVLVRVLVNSFIKHLFVFVGLHKYAHHFLTNFIICAKNLLQNLQQVFKPFIQLTIPSREAFSKSVP